MNYTGRPSISGCRPVLSLYPTHRFCQYLLLIFITFTNSSLFNRAFSTNSRKRLGNNLSVTFGDTSPKGRGFGRPYRFLYLFGEKSGIMVLRPCPPIYSGGEVRKMESILSFILSVGANVAAYYICKWLDGWFMGRKH